MIPPPPLTSSQPIWRRSSPCGDIPTPCWTPLRVSTHPWWFTAAPAWGALAWSSSPSWWSAAWSRTRWVDDQCEWVLCESHFLSFTSSSVSHPPPHSQWRCPPCCRNWGDRGCWWFRPSPSTSLSTRSSSSSSRTPASFEAAPVSAHYCALRRGSRQDFCLDFDTNSHLKKRSKVSVTTLTNCRNCNTARLLVFSLTPL